MSSAARKLPPQAERVDPGDKIMTIGCADEQTMRDFVASLAPRMGERDHVVGGRVTQPDGKVYFFVEAPLRLVADHVLHLLIREFAAEARASETGWS